MLFKTGFHEGIRTGAITRTVRAWQQAQVVAGSEYKFGDTGRIKVDDVEQVELGSIVDEDATASGFESLEGMMTMLHRESRRPLTLQSSVFRVRFHYLGELADQPPAYTDDEIRQRLERMGGWSFEMLREIDARPGVSSALLAEALGRGRQKLKADVRRLKRLGLTRSLEVGYELTATGKKILEPTPGDG